MTKSNKKSRTHELLAGLASVLLQPEAGESAHSAMDRPVLLDLQHDEFQDLVELAQLNHVVVRGLEACFTLMRQEQDLERSQWVEEALAVESARIATAIRSLHEVCSAFEEHGHHAIVIKTLDHWPDFGSDVDLYTNAHPDKVLQLMERCFNARIASRSWGDRLAHKWNFHIPGLPEAIEIHIGRLGQTGEQAAFASSLPKRARTVMVGGHEFQVPSAEDRLMITTLQRMYRHFHFRLCDIVDTAALADADAIDYENLRTFAKAAGIWKGVATLLAIVSDYSRTYRGYGIAMPGFVEDAAKFGGSEIYFERGFLRVPIMPHSALLYGSQLAGTLGRGELQNGARLSLLPWLATAAAAKQKLTGSDKGIW